MSRGEVTHFGRERDAPGLRHELLDITGEGFYLIWGSLPRIFQYEGVEGTHAGFPYLEAFEASFLD
jgi:hypothetical protein